MERKVKTEQQEEEFFLLVFSLLFLFTVMEAKAILFFQKSS